MDVLCCIVLRCVVLWIVQYSIHPDSVEAERSGLWVLGSALRWGRFLAQLSLWEYQGLFSWYEMAMGWRCGWVLAQELGDGVECHR